MPNSQHGEFGRPPSKRTLDGANQRRKTAPLVENLRRSVQKHEPWQEGCQFGQDRIEQSNNNTDESRQHVARVQGCIIDREIRDKRGLEKLFSK